MPGCGVFAVCVPKSRARGLRCSGRARSTSRNAHVPWDQLRGTSVGQPTEGLGRNDADSRRMLRGSREHARAKTGESEEEPLALSVFV